MINVTAPNRVYKEIKSVMNDRLDKVYQQNQHVDGPWSVACEEELKKIYRLLVKTTISEISERIEFGAISTKMKICVS